VLFFAEQRVLLALALALAPREEELWAGGAAARAVSGHLRECGAC